MITKISPALLTVIMAVITALSGCSASGGVQSGSVTAPEMSGHSSTGESAETLPDASTIEGENTLIVYYSYSGTTERVAEHLSVLTEGALYELELADPYTGDSYDVSDRVFAERGNGKMPELTGTLPDVAEYDLILIGTPVWNDSMANPVLSYLQQTDFSGKTVAPFWTYITSQGTTEKNFKSNIRNGNTQDGLALRSANGMSDEKLDETLQNWLDML